MSAVHIPPAQLDLFVPTPAPRGLLDGLMVRVDRPCRCWSHIMVIVDAATGPHAALLRCNSCDRFRRWLPRTAYEFLCEIVRNFGRPTKPIEIFEKHPTGGAAADAIHPAPRSLSK